MAAVSAAVHVRNTFIDGPIDDSDDELSLGDLPMENRAATTPVFPTSAPPGLVEPTGSAMHSGAGRAAAAGGLAVDGRSDAGPADGSLPGMLPAPGGLAAPPPPDSDDAAGQLCRHDTSEETVVVTLDQIVARAQNTPVSGRTYEQQVIVVLEQQLTAAREQLEKLNSVTSLLMATQAAASQAVGASQFASYEPVVAAHDWPQTLQRIQAPPRIERVERPRTPTSEAVILESTEASQQSLLTTAASGAVVPMHAPLPANPSQHTFRKVLPNGALRIAFRFDKRELQSTSNHKTSPEIPCLGGVMVAVVKAVSEARKQPRFRECENQVSLELKFRRHAGAELDPLYDDGVVSPLKISCFVGHVDCPQQRSPPKTWNPQLRPTHAPSTVFDVTGAIFGCDVYVGMEVVPKDPSRVRMT